MPKRNILAHTGRTTKIFILIRNKKKHNNKCTFQNYTEQTLSLFIVCFVFTLFLITFVIYTVLGSIFETGSHECNSFDALRIVFH